MKVTKALENKGILSKGTARKDTTQEGGFLTFLRPLMKAGLPLIKNVITPLAKSVLTPVMQQHWQQMESYSKEKILDQTQQH